MNEGKSSTTVGIELKHRELTDVILRTFYEVYNELGFGFLESVYENSLVIALREKGLNVWQQVKIPVFFRGREVGIFDADVIVENAVLLELKSARAMDEAHSGRAIKLLKSNRS